MGTNFNYDHTSHQVIYDQINGGSGSEPLQLSSQEWIKLGNEIGETGTSYVHSVLGTILTTRQGAAADAAAAAISAMVPWMDNVTQIAHAAAQRAQDQADFWVKAKHSVPPVPPPPKSVGFFSDPGEWVAEKMDWFPGVTSDEETQQRAQQDAAEQARQAMRVYQASSNGNIDSAPAFTAPQALDGSVGTLPLTSSGVGTAAATAAIAGPSAPAHLMAARQPAPQPAPARTPVTPRPASHPPAATVSQLAPGASTGRTGGVMPPVQWAGSPVPDGSAVLDASAAGVTAGAVTRPTRFGSARRSSRSSEVVFSPRPATEFGPRPTANTPPPMDEMSSARGSAAMARGTSGPAGYGAPLAGGPNQQGDQDREHRSKYLLHDDSSAIVGDLPPTAPPVIGADY
ncbi:MAG TPA: PPE domain-containing protein [Pseudonocardiaceae bacterium]|nr:PPE domain-containing protein [Pseudonocardiaceae bacterium]